MFFRIGAASFLDVTAHHVFAEIVIDHVASITLDEFHPLLSASWFHHCIFLQPLHRSALVDRTVDHAQALREAEGAMKNGKAKFSDWDEAKKRIRRKAAKLA